jgi:hypothetical protein
MGQRVRLDGRARKVSTQIIEADRRRATGNNQIPHKPSVRENLGLLAQPQPYRTETHLQKVLFALALLNGIHPGATTAMPVGARRQDRSSAESARPNRLLSEQNDPSQNQLDWTQIKSFTATITGPPQSPRTVDAHGMQPTSAFVNARRDALQIAHYRSSSQSTDTGTKSRPRRHTPELPEAAKGLDIFAKQNFRRRLRPKTIQDYLPNQLFRLDSSTGIPVDMAGLSIETIADHPFVRALAPTLDKSERLALIHASFDKYHIDSAFDIGSALHAMATILKRITGNKYNTSEPWKVLTDFNTLTRQSGSDSPWLRAARVMEIEKSWPELKGDPAQIRTERIMSLVDDLVSQFTSPIKFIHTEAVLPELKEMIGLSHEQLTRELPLIPLDPRLPNPISIWNLFMHLSQFKSYASIYNIYPDRIAVEYNEEHSSPLGPVLRVHFADGAKADLTPSLILEQAIFSFRRKLLTDPWVNVKARIMARESTRKNGELPPANVEKGCVIKRVSPSTPRERAAADLRDKIPSIPYVGEIANIPLLGRDFMDGDEKTFVDKLPFVGEQLSRVEILSNAIKGNAKVALRKSFELLPRKIGAAYKWMKTPEESTENTQSPAISMQIDNTSNPNTSGVRRAPLISNPQGIFRPAKAKGPTAPVN